MSVIKDTRDRQLSRFKTRRAPHDSVRQSRLDPQLLVNLRTPLAFILQFIYVVFLGVVVYFYWPAGSELGVQVSSGVARRLFDLFFLGQFFLVAAGRAVVRGRQHHRRKRAENLRDAPRRPLKPSTILIGKLLSSLSYLVLLIVSSLPLMILCFLLGGILLSEIARAYLVLILAAGTFGLLSVACSSYFRRTSSALVVGYLIILPLAVACVALTHPTTPRRATSSRSRSCPRGAWRPGPSWRSS